MLTKKAKYALKAALYLARRESEGALLIAEIAAAEGLPKKFLESILLAMKNHGLMTSRKGRGGGYALARPAAQITFGEIVRLMNGPLAPVPCSSATSYHPCDECRSEKNCEIRTVLKRARDAISSVLDDTSLADALRPPRAGAKAADAPTAPGR